LAREDLSVIEERMPPGTAGQRHRHQRSRQFFFVLEGEART
jgi:mannose-6-phosphate isomerase-like protein (cupin superfamily)